MLGRVKRALRGGEGGQGRVTSPSPPTQRASQRVSVSAPVPQVVVSHPGRQPIAPADVVLGARLGEGHWGVVHQSTWTTGSGDKIQVSAKRLHSSCVEVDQEEVLRQVAALQELEHEGLLRLYGLLVDQGDLIMVTELAPLRSMLECLQDPMLRLDLSLPRLCDFAQQCCEALAYLEASKVVHGGVAARNLMVFTKNQVKLSDVSLSSVLGAGMDYYLGTDSNGTVPAAWCAPEVLSNLQFSPASDVWSFAVMLWEFFSSGSKPWEGLNGPQIQSTLESGRDQRLEQPDLCTAGFYDLMQECWAMEPADRPTFASLLLRLPQLRPTQVKALKDYPSPITERGYMYYKAGDVIVVIDKSPSSSNPPGLVWRGVLANGNSGLFDPTNVVPFIETKISPVKANPTLVRKGTPTQSVIESGRKSRKLRADMISKPQNDLRHTGHIGYDGAVFGDVSFIGDKMDKLPIKEGASRGSSMTSINKALDSTDHNGHSEDGLSRRGQSCDARQLSRDSLSSQSTFQSADGRDSPSYLDVEDDSLFADFKMPDMGTSFDFGPSFMDEVLKALDDKEKQIIGSDSVTPTDAGHSFEDELPARSAAPRQEVNRSSMSASAPPLPSQPPRVEPPKEKKQAKVKPMSASDERMVDTALDRARELTSHMIGDDRRSPPVSPAAYAGDSGSRTFFEEDNSSNPGIISKLKNSIRRSSPKSERKRTFSDNMENSSKDLDSEVTPEAQQAYNMLVVRGNSVDKSEPSYHHGSNGTTALYVSETERMSEPEPVAQEPARRVTPPEPIKPHVFSSQRSRDGSSSMGAPPPVPPSSRPEISAPQLQTKPIHGVSLKSTNYNPPVPAPRPVKPEPAVYKKPTSSDVPVPKPRPEIQRVEPTIRHPEPESPDLPPKVIPIPATRQDSREHDREQFKRTIEIVRVEDNNYLNEDSVEKSANALDMSSAMSSQRSSLDRSDNTSENAESECAQSEYSSDSSKPLECKAAPSSLGTVERKDSFSKAASSLFTDEFDEPSPQEIMSKLREKRLNRHIERPDRSSAASGDGDGAGVTASRPPARKAIIPGRLDQDEEDQETNPLRMLRGGAIPIRTTGMRSSAGRRIAKR